MLRVFFYPKFCIGTSQVNWETMRKFILTLPKYRLSVSYKVIKRRKSPLDEPLIPSTKTLNTKYRVGGPIRKLIRHIFEHKKVKALLGTNIALILVASSFMPSSVIGSSNMAATNEVVSIDSTNNPIKTEIGTRFPVEKVSITQTYSFIHPGLDLDGVTGDPIISIKKGTVVHVSREKFSYGNSVIIDHGNGLTSLYAHLSKIYVKEGQMVTTDTQIGEMGATGHAFGDHLHFEVRENGIRINPLSVLPR